MRNPSQTLSPQSEPEPAVKSVLKPASRIRQFRDGDGWLYAEVGVAVAGLIGLAFLIPAGYALWVDLQDRQTQRIAQAWELVTRAAPGNSGKGPALKYIHSQGIPLTGINLSSVGGHSGSYLRGVELSGADLSRANLRNADLSKADLQDTDLSAADLNGADLSGADLRGAYLVQQRIDRACGNEESSLPEGLTIKPCPEK